MTERQEFLLLCLTDIDFHDRESYLKWKALWKLRYETISKQIRNRRQLHRTVAAEYHRLQRDSRAPNWEVYNAMRRAWTAVEEGRQAARDALKIRAASKQKCRDLYEVNCHA